MSERATMAGRVEAPVFPAAEGESQTDLGRRAVLFLLAMGDTATWRLDDGQLQAAAEYCSVASAACRRDEIHTVARLARLQGILRGLVTARAADRRVRLEALQALFGEPATQEPAGAPIASQAGSQGPAQGNGGGGSKVPRKPRPQGPAPSASLQLPALRPLAPLSLGEEAL